MIMTTTSKMPRVAPASLVVNMLIGRRRRRRRWSSRRRSPVDSLAFGNPSFCRFFRSLRGPGSHRLFLGSRCLRKKSVLTQ
jgi:hypothetical protein